MLGKVTHRIYVIDLFLLHDLRDWLIGYSIMCLRLDIQSDKYV